MKKFLKPFGLVIASVVVLTLIITAGATYAETGELTLDRIMLLFLENRLNQISGQVPLEDTGLAMVGTIGTKAIENYLPIVKYNDGIYSTLTIQSSGTVQGGTVTDGTISMTGGAISGITSFSVTSGGIDITAGDLDMTNGDINLSSGVASVTGETSTSTLEEDVLTLIRASGTGYGTDGISPCIKYKGFDSNGNATSTGKICLTLDDVTSGSEETSMIFYQLLDNGIALSNVMELDSGDLIVNTNDLFVDYSTNRVGIQNAAPTKTLDVTGTLAVSGESIFAGNVVTGGATTTITATTSAGDLLLTAAQLCDGGEEIELTSAIELGGFTLTLPTAALLAADCFGTNGHKTIWVDNNSGSNATVTAGTGGDLLEGDSLNVVIATTRQASIEIQMLDSGNSYRASVVEWQDAD